MTTVWPVRRPVTSVPSATICATHSCPIANGPRNGTRPQMHATTGSIDECVGRLDELGVGALSPCELACALIVQLAHRGRLPEPLRDRDGVADESRLGVHLGEVSQPR
jgi:hypothetical protein